MSDVPVELIEGAGRVDETLAQIGDLTKVTGIRFEVKRISGRFDLGCGRRVAIEK